jgi:ABC-type transport system substrate-binding protein
VQVVNAPDPTAQGNAFRSGAGDIADNVSSVVVGAVTGLPNFKIIPVKTDNQITMGYLCKSSGPLANVQVRQALNYAMPKAAINLAVFGGKGLIMNSMVNKSNPLYNKKFDNSYPYNLTKAKALLTQAGYPNGFTLHFLLQPGDLTVASQIVQSSWAKIGVNLNLTTSTNILNDFFNSKPTSAFDGGLGQYARPYIEKLTRAFIPGGSGDICQTDFPDLDAVVDQLRQVPASSPQAKALWTKAEDIIVGQALTVFGIFNPVNEIVSTNLANVSYVLAYNGLPTLWLPDMYVVKK